MPGCDCTPPLLWTLQKCARPIQTGACSGGQGWVSTGNCVAGRGASEPPSCQVSPRAIAAAAVAPSTLTAAAAAFAVAAWLHAASDVLGGSPEMDPSDPSDRAVYDHRRGRWLRPRRWIDYDGSPGDAALAVALAVPALIVFDGPIATVVAVGIAVSLGYALVRRRLVDWMPDWVE